VDERAVAGRATREDSIDRADSGRWRSKDGSDGTGSSIGGSTGRTIAGSVLRVPLIVGFPDVGFMGGSFGGVVGAFRTGTTTFFLMTEERVDRNGNPSRRMKSER
jgi:hypothetical protein